MTRLPAIAWLAALAACGESGPQAEGTGRVRLLAPGAADTIRFEVPVVARRCAGGGGILVNGAREGYGVLVLLRATSAAVDTGSYPLLTRADSGATPGLIVAVRYSIGPVSHGLTVDDGSGRVRRVTPTLSVAVEGRGMEAGVGGQRTVELTLEDVSLGPDSAFCRVQP